MKHSSFLLSVLSAALLLPCAAQSEAASTINPQIQAVAQAAVDNVPEDITAPCKVLHTGILVADPKTGNILAMAEHHADGAPHADLLKETHYEPGNTFTIITTAAMLETRGAAADIVFNCSPFSVAHNDLITDNILNHGALPVWGIVAKGSHPGAARLALACNSSAFCGMLTRFGFTNKPQEGSLLSACCIPDCTQVPVLAHVSFGTRLTVTPLHMLAAYAAIANKGVYMEPRLTADGTPTEGRRVVSEENAAALLGMLEAATRWDNPIPVRRGIAARAGVPGVRIAAMTGAQQICRMLNPDRPGDYTKQYFYNLSCVALLPADAPQLAIIVYASVKSTDDEEGSRPANVGPISGGTVAAPFFRAAVRGLIKAGVLQPADPAAYAEYLKTL